MTATTFLTQRQLMSKNMPADALTGPYAQQQKLLLYVLPVVFAVGGIAFPIGVLLYWTTSNLWTMGQQFYVIRNNPAPGTPAFAAKEERDAGKAARHGVVARPAAARTGTTTATEPETDRRPRRGSSPSGSRASSARRASGRRTPGSTPNPTRRRHRSERARPTDDARRTPSRRHRPPDRADRRARSTSPTETDDDAEAGGRAEERPPSRQDRLENEGDIAADYLEELLDIADLDGDLDMDVEGDRASVSIVGADLAQLVGRDGEVLDALQELTRLAVYRETGERSRLMLDISGYRAAEARASWSRWPPSLVARVKETGEPASLDPMSPFERKVVHDAVAAAGLTSESEGVEPKRFVVVLPQ